MQFPTLEKIFSQQNIKSENKDKTSPYKVNSALFCRTAEVVPHEEALMVLAIKKHHQIPVQCSLNLNVNVRDKSTLQRTY